MTASLKNIVINTVGAPKVNQEVWPGDYRVFSPQVFSEMLDANKELKFFLEKNYWEGTEFSKQDYKNVLGDKLKWVSKEDIFQSDLVMVFKYPSFVGEAEKVTLEHEMKSNSVLLTMAHFHSRPKRVQYLVDNNIEVISLDEVGDENGRKTFDRNGTGDGILPAYEIVRKLSDNFEELENNTLEVVILGGGQVGSAAAAGLLRYRNRISDEIKVNFKFIDLNESRDNGYINDKMKGAHMIVDATSRRNYSEVIINEEHLDLMKYKVVADLAGDDPKAGKNDVKAIGSIKILGNRRDLIFEGDIKSQHSMGLGSEDIYEYDELGRINKINLPNQKYNSEKVYVSSSGSWPASLSMKNFRNTIEYNLIPLLREVVKKPEDRGKLGDLYISVIRRGLLSTFLAEKA